MACSINRLGFIQQKDSQLWAQLLERLDVQCEADFSGANVNFTGATITGLSTGDQQSVSKSGDQAIPTGAATTLISWSAAGTGQTSNANFVLATGIYTVPTTGTYVICGSVTWEANPTNNFGNRITRVNVNAGTIVKELITQPTPNAAIPTTQTYTILLSLTAADTVRIEVEQNSGAAADVDGTVGTVLSIVQVV